MKHAMKYNYKKINRDFANALEAKLVLPFR